MGSDPRRSLRPGGDVHAQWHCRPSRTDPVYQRKNPPQTASGRSITSSHIHRARRAMSPKPFLLAAEGLGASGDEVEEGGFAGTVGADDGAQFALVEVEIQVVDGLEAIEGFDQPLGGQEKGFRAHGSAGSVDVRGGDRSAAGCLRRIFALIDWICAGRPTMPLGMNITTRTKAPPRIRT